MQYLTDFVKRIQGIGADPTDNDEKRLEKRLFVLASILILLATTAWGITYVLNHEFITGILSLCVAIFSLASLIAIGHGYRIRIFIYIQLIFGLAIPFLDTFLLGGLTASSLVLLWSLISPLAALLFFSKRQAFMWVIIYYVLVFTAAFSLPLATNHNHFSPVMITIFYAINIGGVSAIVLIVLNYFMQQKNEAMRLLKIEQAKAESLLLNILPKEIAAILKNESRTIADNFSGASILFADLVGFTPLTAKMAPVEMVNLLNQIFTFFDGLVEKYDLEKIRTIGDNYMVASGVPRPRPDHAQVLARMALDIQEYIRSLPPIEDRRIQFRVGINSGAVVGGVIGRKKFVYDLWGDAVNIASRMESQGIAGKIQITQATYDLIHTEFTCEPRGEIEVKGRGPIETWFLLGAVDSSNILSRK